MNWYYQLWEQAELERQDRLQYAVANAIGTAFGVMQEFSSLYFRDQLAIPPSKDQPRLSLTGKPFPYDVHYLPKDQLQKLHQCSIDHNQELWPVARLQAYEGKDLCAKRAAVSAFLWDRYAEDPTMTLEKLQVWREIEVIEQLLQVPSWFRNQFFGQDILTLWNAKLGTERARLEARHQELLQELLVN